MSVEREKLDAVVRGVTEHDHRTIVLRRRIVGERVDDAWQRRKDRRSRVSEQVEPDVNRPMLVRRTRSKGEFRSDIQQSRLVVSTNRRYEHRRPSSRKDAIGEQRLSVASFVARR
jgi:hypothetical protein